MALRLMLGNGQRMTRSLLGILSGKHAGRNFSHGKVLTPSDHEKVLTPSDHGKVLTPSTNYYSPACLFLQF